MAKVTSKLQVTIPKAIAQAHGIRPGMELEFESAHDVIRVRTMARAPLDVAARLHAYDQGTRRQTTRNRAFRKAHPELVEPANRGWRRADLYDRGLAR